MKDFIKGMDVSTLAELRQLGAKYYDEGQEASLLSILKKYGTDSLRLRLWHNPYTEDGKAYGAGTNDFPKLVEMAKEGKELGMGFLLDLHYSDFWTDPGKQITPKAWQGLTVEQLEKEVYEYTKKVLLDLKEQDLVPEMVQVGNEVTNGLLWPLGQWDNCDNIARFISAGIRAVRECAPGVPVMLHLDCGGNNERCREWFDAYMQRGEDFEVIGLSYYPFWHGTVEDLTNNMNDLVARYQKDLVVAEISTGFTLEDYKDYEKLPDEERKGMAAKPHLAQAVAFPMTKEGQAAFMQEVMEQIAKLPDGRGKGFYYWEPAWIPVPGCGWANEYSLPYINDPGPGGNEWANQALFDYDGHALPSLKTIRDFKKSDYQS